MKQAPFDYRHRYAVHTIVYILGFCAYFIPSQRDPAWITLTPVLRKTGIFSFSSASLALLIAAFLVAAIGAALRTWGSSYLGAGVVEDGSMHGNRILADGPYRYLRNPLYLGTILHTLAISLLMPSYGALFTVVAITLLQFRLIAVEEPFLQQQLGEAYLEYKRRVPRILPALRARVPASGARPQWLAAILSESYMLCVALSFFAFDVLYLAKALYNPFILQQCVLVSFGLSLVLRAFAPKPANV
jgi:protein-S-isoprenylcysteine O-methyltransferase Ste14